MKASKTYQRQVVESPNFGVVSVSFVHFAKAQIMDSFKKTSICIFVTWVAIFVVCTFCYAILPHEEKSYLILFRQLSHVLVGIIAFSACGTGFKTLLFIAFLARQICDGDFLLKIEINTRWS